MKIFSKLCLFLLPLVVLIGFDNYYFSSSQKIDVSPDKKNIFFIGSSRVKRGIDPALLNKSNENIKIYNFGISGSTFFNNIVFAENSIKNYSPEKVFIELSPVRYNIHEEHQKLGIPLSTFAKSKLDIDDYINGLESYLYDKINLKRGLKKILGVKKPDSVLGYLFSNYNGYAKTDTFLKKEDLTKEYKSEISAHKELIDYLAEVADKYNTEIYYFLPITFLRNQEREVVSTVFKSLPKESKAIYTNKFLNDISNSEYLIDKIHLNNKGAEIMTNYFKEIYFDAKN